MFRPGAQEIWGASQRVVENENITYRSRTIVNDVRLPEVKIGRLKDRLEDRLRM